MTLAIFTLPLLLTVGASAAASAPAPAPAPVSLPPGFRCESRVYVYLDKSASLSSSERVHLAESLGKVLRSSTDGPISDYKNVYIRSFAGTLGSPDEVKPPQSLDNSEITKKVKEVFRRPEVITEGQSNLVNVLGDIEKRLGKLKNSHAKGNVFIIASDFVHDQTEEEDGVSKRSDWEGWQTATADDSALWQTLTASFRDPGEGNILLLLPLNAQEDPLRIGEKVLAQMRSLTLYDGQVTAKGELDLQGLARFLKPLAVEHKVVRDGTDFYHDVLIENHSCVRLPPLQVRLSPGATNSYDDFKMLAAGHFRSKRPIPEPQNSRDPESRPASDYDVHVQIAGAEAADDLQREKINTDEYIFLSELSLVPNHMNQGFNGRALFSQVYWRPGLKVKLALKNREETVGSSREIKISEISSLEPSLAELQDVSIDVGTKLADICYKPHWKDGRLKLKIATDPPGAAIQSYLLPVKIRNPDGETDLLEDLAQQGSLPALCTLATMLLMFAGRRSVSMGTVEETLAVVGLFWITAFLLAHHVPSIGVWLDILLSGTPASIVGAAICVLLAGFLYMLLGRGAIGPVRDSADIMLEVEKKAAGIPMEIDPRAKWFHCKFVWSLKKAKSWSLGLWGVIVLTVLMMCIGGGLLLDPPEPDCILEVSESIAISGY